jgi:hypothetical protein
MTLRRRILLFAVFLLLPAIGGGAFLVAGTYARERAALEDTLRDTGRAMALVVDREFDRRAAIVQLLAASASLQRWDLEGFDREARAAIIGLRGQVAVYDRETQYVNTLLPFGSRRPAAKGLPVQFAESSVELSDLFTGAVSGKRLMAMNAAVQVDARLLNVSISIIPEELQQIIEEQRLPAGWTVAVVNRQGRIIARQPNPERWVGASATQDLLQQMQKSKEGSFDSTTLDGIRSAAFFSTGPRYDATFVIGVPRSELEESLYRSMSDVAIGAAILLLLGLGVSVWAANRMLRPVQALRAAALDLEEGREVKVERTGLVSPGPVRHAAGELDAGLRPAGDLDVPPGERAGDPEAERLAHGLLAREPGRVVLRGIRPGVAVRALGLCEDAVPERGVAHERPLDAPDLDEVEADLHEPSR